MKENKRNSRSIDFFRSIRISFHLFVLLQSEIRQTEEDKYCLVSFICGI